MLNRKLLLVSSGADAPSTIGVAGGQGFGVGVYPGSKAELAAMQLTPISGFDCTLWKLPTCLPQHHVLCSSILLSFGATNRSFIL